MIRPAKCSIGLLSVQAVLHRAGKAANTVLQDATGNVDGSLFVQAWHGKNHGLPVVSTVGAPLVIINTAQVVGVVRLKSSSRKLNQRTRHDLPGIGTCTENRPATLILAVCLGGQQKRGRPKLLAKAGAGQAGDMAGYLEPPSTQ